MTSDVLTDDLARIHVDLGAGDRFRDATVLVTGCAGFLGFSVLQYLVRQSGALGLRRIIGLDTFLLDRPAWLDDLARRHPDVLDLRAFDIARTPLETIAGAANARFVIHMASIASPTFYRRHPVETIDANVWGLRRLLDFYREAPALEGILFFSSSEVYGDPEPHRIPTDETYRGCVSSIGPRACYDESKRFGETLCYVYAKLGMPITIVRPFNNYGPGMRLGDRRLPADFARCVIEERDLVILSSGTPTRTFCYVSDAVTGYLKCLLHGRFDAFNIGIDAPEISVRRLAEIYREAGRELFGYDGAIRHETSGDADYLTDNPDRRCPDITKARTLLGYAPRVSVEDGVRRYLRFLEDQRP